MGKTGIIDDKMMFRNLGHRYLIMYFHFDKIGDLEQVNNLSTNALTMMKILKQNMKKINGNKNVTFTKHFWKLKTRVMTALYQCINLLLKTTLCLEIKD